MHSNQACKSTLMALDAANGWERRHTQLIEITAEEWAKRERSGDASCCGRVAEVEEARLLAEAIVNAEAEAVTAAMESRRAALVAEIRAAVLAALVEVARVGGAAGRVGEVVYEVSGA